MEGPFIPGKHHYNTPDANPVEIDDADLAKFPGVTLAGDLPFHKVGAGKSLAEGGSPFLSLGKYMMPSRFEDFVKRSHALQQAWRTQLTVLKRLAPFYVDRKPDRLATALASELERQVHIPDSIFLEMLLGFPRPLFVAGLTDAWSVELGQLRASACQKGTAYEETVTEMLDNDRSRQFRIQTISATLRCYENFDAVLPALAFERMKPKVREHPEDFRISRDDFEVLKGIYVDVFELFSRSFGFLGLEANLSHRQDRHRWLDANTRTLAKFLRLRAVDREFVVKEFPAVNKLSDQVRRHTRNDIGHYSIWHDVSTGELVASDGQRTPFLLFLSDFLGACRLTPYLVAWVDSLTREEDVRAGRAPDRDHLPHVT